MCKWLLGVCFFFECADFANAHPGKLTWKLKMRLWKRRNIYKPPILGSMLAFWGCMSPCSPSIQAVGKLFEALLSITACGQGKLGGEPDTEDATKMPYVLCMCFNSRRA